MQQPMLFNETLCAQHTVQGNNITAVFCEKEDGAYDVTLSVSSHKFLLHVKPGYHDIEEFEIISMRGFMDYNVSLLHTVKKIMGHICYGK